MSHSDFCARLLVAIAVCFHLQCKQITNPRHASYREAKYYLSVCAVFRNETKYLKEWIEYHRLVGVDHFYLYNNNSLDRPAGILKSYIDKGIVTLIHWPDRLGQQRDTFMWSLGVQISAYENAIYWAALKETTWLAILDIDEFLVPSTENNLVEMLEKYKQYPGVVLSKAYYDASSADVSPSGSLIIESIGMIENPFREFLPKSVEKMIFRPKMCESFTWTPYRCVFKKNQQPIVLTKLEMRVNHYSNRSKKVLEGERNKRVLHIDQRFCGEQQVSELLHAGYAIEDAEKAVYRFVPEVLRRM